MSHQNVLEGHCIYSRDSRMIYLNQSKASISTSQWQNFSVTLVCEVVESSQDASFSEGVKSTPPKCM